MQDKRSVYLPRLVEDHNIWQRLQQPYTTVACVLQEDSFHLVDNRPTKTPKFGNRRFQQNKFQQQRRDRELKQQDGGDKKKQQQKKNPWQWQGRDQQRVSGLIRVTVVYDTPNNQVRAACSVTGCTIYCSAKSYCLLPVAPCGPHPMSCLQLKAGTIPHTRPCKLLHVDQPSLSVLCLQMIQYSSSVDIRPEWAVKEQIPFTSLIKLQCNVGEPTNLLDCGELEFYDKSYDRISSRSEKPLERTKRVFRSVTTSDDPIIRKLAAEDKARVFITDTILTCLMCVKSSVYSWDVVITRAGDKLFFDKRDGGSLDLLSVNETAPDQIPEDKDNINGVQQLSLEATTINQNLSQQVGFGGNREGNSSTAQHSIVVLVVQ